MQKAKEEFIELIEKFIENLGINEKIIGQNYLNVFKNFSDKNELVWCADEIYSFIENLNFDKKLKRTTLKQIRNIRGNLLFDFEIECSFK